MSENNTALNNKGVLKKLRKARENKDWTQDDLAELLGISQKAYSKIETGETKLSLERTKKLADILEIDITELLAEEEKIIVGSISNSKSVNFGNKSVTNQDNGLDERERELYEKRISHLEDEILFLRQIISNQNLQQPPVL